MYVPCIDITVSDSRCIWSYILLHMNITSRVLYVVYAICCYINIHLMGFLHVDSMSQFPKLQCGPSVEAGIAQWAGIRHLKPFVYSSLGRIFFSLLWKSAMVGIEYGLYNFSILMDDPGVQSVQNFYRILLFGKWHGARNYTRKLLNMAG